MYTVTAGAWASAAAMNTARKALGGAYGTTTAGLVAGGHSTPNAGITDSEEFDGSSWTEGPNMNTARGWIACCGTQTAALYYGGNPGGAVTTSLSYDGTNWITSPSMAQARAMMGSSAGGTSTAALASSGAAPTATEEFTGETTALNAENITDS